MSWSRFGSEKDPDWDCKYGDDMHAAAAFVAGSSEGSADLEDLEVLLDFSLYLDFFDLFTGGSELDIIHGTD